MPSLMAEPLGPPTTPVEEFDRLLVYASNLLTYEHLTRMRFRFHQTNQLLANPMEDLSR
jgi:hypothetical protein